MNSPTANLKIEGIEGRGVPLRGDDIDTDQIMPARFLKWITFQGLEAHVFADLRAPATGKSRAFPLDDPRFAGAEILLVNRNFGCGSSREHAPQAILRFGIKAIIGASFGEIFAGNCVAIGMPCVVVSADAVDTLQALVDKEPGTAITLDLVARNVSAGGQTFPVEIAEGRRQQFLDGSWHPTMALLAAGEAIDAKMQALPYARWSSNAGGTTPAP